MRTAALTETVLPEVEETVREVVADVRETVGEVVTEAAVRGSAAWDALRGERVGPPVAVRRWPWALAAALAGAAGAVAVVLVARRLRYADAPDAVEPEELEAVIDRA